MKVSKWTRPLLFALGILCWLLPAQLSAQQPNAPPRLRNGMKGARVEGEGREGRPRHRPGERWGRGAEVQELMAKLKKEQPEEFERLEALSKSDRVAYYAEIGKMLPERSMRNSKLGALEQQCRDLGIQYREAQDEKEKARLKAELEAAVKESFDLMLADSKRRLEALQERLDSLEAKEGEILAQRLDFFLNGSERWRRPGRDDAAAPPPEK